MQLVDEEHDVARAALDFVEDPLDAAFEFAAIFRAGDERAEREREQPFAAQRRRRIGAGHALRQAFDDRRLADARLADETGIVLAAPRENRNDAFDLFVAADHRIELSVARQLGEIARVCGERRRSAAKLLAERVERRFGAVPAQFFGQDGAAGNQSGGSDGRAEDGQRRGGGPLLSANAA